MLGFILPWTKTMD